MYRLVIFVVFLYSLHSVHAQKRKQKEPKCKNIKKVISDQHSPNYYPVLLDRFLKSDSTLNLKEKRLLYYGYVFQDEYKNDRNRNYKDSLSIFFSVDRLNDIDAGNVIRFSDSILVDNPFNLRALNYRALAFEHLGENKRYNGVIFRINTVLEVILSSGHGLSPDSPFYVIRESDEYALIDALGFMFEGHKDKIEGKYDHLTVIRNDDGAKIKGLYFFVFSCDASSKDK